MSPTPKVLASAPLAGSEFVVLPQDRQSWQDYSIYGVVPGGTRCDALYRLAQPQRPLRGGFPPRESILRY